MEVLKIINEGRQIGEGRIRRTYEYQGKVYKFSINRCGSQDNRSEYILSNMCNKNFLNKVLDISNDGRCIEVDPCIELSEFCKEIGVNIKSIDAIDSYIDILVERYPKLKEYMDYTMDEVKEFIKEKCLDIKEMLFPYNWMYNPRLNKIVCTDFGE